jgi:alpha-beta hydrolase superfamily lysophospholipase
MILAAVVAWLAVTAAQAQIVRLATPGGTPFAIVGRKAAKPAPTLLIFAGSIEQTLDEKFYPLATKLKQERGFLLVTLDLPGHGADRREGEPASIASWRTRMERGERVIENFVAKVSPVLDYLVSEGYADPARIVAAGTSRGGFMAFHAAAAEARIRAVMAFAPVTDLLALSEFTGMQDHAGVRALAAENLAPRLAGRPIWMCIGNHDTRVDTDRAIRFTRRVVECAVAAGKRPDIELWVQPSEGHQIAPDSHEKAAAWLVTRILALPAGGR